MRAATTIAAVTALALLLAAPALAERGSSQAREFQAGLVAAGANHTCAVLANGSAVCWGLDSTGQVGDGPEGEADHPAPAAVLLPAGRRAVAVAAGSRHSCALLDDGSLACWGFDLSGQVGDGADDSADERAPVGVALPGGRRATSVVAGSDHTCAILADGALACWGADGFGQVGDGADGNADEPAPVLVALPGGRRAAAVAAGATHTCAILDDGSLACWGHDINGQLGDGPDGNADEPAPVLASLPAGRRAVAITAGTSHTCAILDDGSLACWGYDLSGQVGDGADGNADEPAPVAIALPGGRRALAVSAGGSHTCAITDDGALACWGYDAFGQVGDGADGNADEPAPVAGSLAGGRVALAVDAGFQHTCALAQDGSVSCWGIDLAGQLGDGADGNADETSIGTAPRPLAPGSVAGRAADVSVAIEGAPATAAVGVGATLGVRVANAGPDAVTGLRVQLVPTLLSLAATTIGQGTVTGAHWTVGTLAPGTSTLLQLRLTPVAVGAGSLVAQVAAADQADPDSVPANGAAEDDQAEAAITVAARRLAPERLTLSLTVGRDATAPHRTIAQGRLVATRVADRAGCRGTVTVKVTSGTRTVRRRSVKLRLRDGACQYSASIAVTAAQRGGARRVRIVASFPGNAALLGTTSRPRALRLT
ncbi:MAG: hypothetical protein R3C15_13665 [Thermoleophilia bacterium]